MEDREHAAVAVLIRYESELAEDAVDVLSNGAAADDHRLGDGGVGPAFGHQREDLALTAGQHAERTAAAGEQLSHDLGVERAAALGHPAERVEEFRHVSHPVLEQVSDA